MTDFPWKWLPSSYTVVQIFMNLWFRILDVALWCSCHQCGLHKKARSPNFIPHAKDMNVWSVDSTLAKEIAFLSFCLPCDGLATCPGCLLPSVSWDQLLSCHLTSCRAVLQRDRAWSSSHTGGPGSRVSCSILAWGQIIGSNPCGVYKEARYCRRLARP